MMIGADPALRPATTDDHVFLLGRPPLGEFLAFITTQMVGGEDADVRLLAQEWRDANDRIRQLEVDEAGTADGAPTRPIDEDLTSLVDAVRADPVFDYSFRIVPAEIASVDLDHLVVFQKQINLRYVRELRERLGAAPDPRDVFRFCLPFDHLIPPAGHARSAQNAWVFSSPSTDFRFLGPSLLRSEQVPGYPPTGVASAVVALGVGYGGNYLNVVQSDGRLVLNNGSHRAYALREHGIKEVPAVIQRVSRREELGALVAGDFEQNPDRYLGDPRPPMLRDYFDDALRKVIPVERRARQVRISFGVEQFDVPMQV